MFKSYLITASRFFLRNKLITGFSIMGLAIGLTGALFVFLFIQYEYSVDRFHEKIDHIYRLIIVGESRAVNSTIKYRTDIVEQAVTQLSKQYPEIKNLVRLMPWRAGVEYKQGRICEDRFWFTDPHIFDLLTLPLQRGNPNTVLQHPYSVVITPAMAVKYFGGDDPIGKKISVLMSRWPVSYNFTVTGILNPLPKNSSFKIDFLAYVPFNRLSLDRKKSSGDRFVNAWAITLLELPDSSAVKSLQNKLQSFQFFSRYKKMSFRNMGYRLEPFKDAYLKSKATFFESLQASHRRDETMRTSDGRLLTFLAGLGIIILAVSCLNFINLSTERMVLRTKEIGVRKVAGASQKQLIAQFLSESILLSLVSLLLALCLAEMLLPSFNTLIQRELSIEYQSNRFCLAVMVSIATLTGLIAGIYPAFFLSALKPASALGALRVPSVTRLRKGLLTVQIGLCVVVFIFASVMIGEIKNLRNRPIGFDSHNLIFFELDDMALAERYPSFKQAILQIPGVLNVTASNFVPWQWGGIPSHAWYNEDVAAKISLLAADTTFMQTYQIPLVAGEGFKTDRTKMDGYIIINQSARQALSSGGVDPLWKNICIMVGWCNRVRGIMGDFNYFYPIEPIEPLAIVSSRYLEYLQNQISIRLAEGSHAPVLKAIEKVLKRFFPKAGFDYRYVAKEMEKTHARKLNYRWMALIFTTGFTLFMSVVGLFSFATYEAERCTKDIGVRKALGAKPRQIAWYYIRRFVKLTLVANLIAWPVCYFLIQQILKSIDYPYQVRIQVTHFLWAGLLTLLFTAAAVCVQTYRAARIDPVKALKYE